MASPAGPRMPLASAVPGIEDLLQAKEQGIPPFKVSDPLSVVEMALEVEVERSRAKEALVARDAAIQRLADAYSSIRQKMTIIERLQQSPQERLPNEQVISLEMTVKALREELAMAHKSNVLVKSNERLQSYDENGIDHAQPGPTVPLRVPLMLPRETPPPSCRSSDTPARAAPPPNDIDHQARFQSKPIEPEDFIKARHAVLAGIPLPADPPDDTLKPISIPSPLTLHEFLANTNGSLRTMQAYPKPQMLLLTYTHRLSNYRVLQELTTSWCPDREEHGYMLTPLFKCNTNPRVATAHRWTMVDVMQRMNKPTECFYNKDGNWYYAGAYKGFRFDDLTVREWEALSTETSQALVKDTVAGRKNTSPQNVYETSQLYTAGALRVACIGLQCVGFNKMLYRAIMDHAAKCMLMSKWKGSTPPPGAGLGPAGAAWNATANEVMDGSGIAGLSITGNENAPVQGGKAKK
ncbi:hypothetical protein FB45DRAFT_941020 [Roridomyces roridus]|uniref:DUF6697 domain-containing protein n=1 Tax=Roridomyces roridus TaxID=1738132 RepID=A0AAD7FD31_9AGAR|nr:hypothetical protein FB45DRAFT_941020 [Roridomyces roridus]